MGVGASVYKSTPLPPHSFRTITTTATASSLFISLFVFQTEPSVGDQDPSRARARRTVRKMMMDRQAVRQCDMEVMKMAMLKHEETFRQQVNELHRLYRIQRQLMSDLTRDEPPVATRRRSKQPRRALDLQLPADEYIVSADEDDEAAGAELLELTLAVGGRSAGRRKNSNRRRQEQHGSPGGSDDCSGASLLSSSPSSAGYYSDDAPAAVFHAPPAPAPPPPCQRVMAFDLGDGMMRQQAPWLMQCQQYLSLRMT